MTNDERTGYRSGERSPDLPRDEARPRPAPPRPPICDICGTRMTSLHCKLVCPTCGYQRDCSDP